MHEVRLDDPHGPNRCTRASSAWGQERNLDGGAHMHADTIPVLWLLVTSFKQNLIGFVEDRASRHTHTGIGSSAPRPQVCTGADRCVTQVDVGRSTCAFPCYPKPLRVGTTRHPCRL